MKPKNLIFRYGQGDFDGMRGLKATRFVLGFFVLLVLGMVALDLDAEVIVVTMGVGAVVSLAVFAVKGGVKGLIIIGRRFIIIRQEIFYYQNLTQVKIESEKGTITLFKQSYPACVIKVGDFPTNARHEPKITNNRRNKFEKVKTKLLKRIEAAAPELSVQR